VDGGWGEWSAWSECKTSCGAVAASDEALNDSQQTRSRQCDQPRPTNGGQDCVGPPTESIPCPSTPCPGILPSSSLSSSFICSFNNSIDAIIKHMSSTKKAQRAVIFARGPKIHRQHI